MNRVHWWLRQTVDRHGWPAMLGAVLLFGCAIFYLAVVVPIERQLGDSPAATSAMPTSGAKGGKPSERDLRKALTAFYGYFPDRQALQVHLAEIHLAAQRAGVSLRRADYRVVETDTGRLRQYRIVVPVTDTYPRIRQFVSALLSAVPMASLDGLSLQRRRVSDATVEAELQVTLFFVDQG